MKSDSTPQPQDMMFANTPGPILRKVVAARNTVYGVPFLDQSSRQGGNMHSLVPISDYDHLAKVGSRQGNHVRPSAINKNV